MQALETNFKRLPGCQSHQKLRSTQSTNRHIPETTLQHAWQNLNLPGQQSFQDKCLVDTQFIKAMALGLLPCTPKAPPRSCLALCAGCTVTYDAV